MGDIIIPFEGFIKQYKDSQVQFVQRNFRASRLDALVTAVGRLHANAEAHAASGNFLESYGEYIRLIALVAHILPRLDEGRLVVNQPTVASLQRRAHDCAERCAIVRSLVESKYNEKRLTQQRASMVATEASKDVRPDNIAPIVLPTSATVAPHHHALPQSEAESSTETAAICAVAISAVPDRTDDIAAGAAAVTALITKLPSPTVRAVRQGSASFPATPPSTPPTKLVAAEVAPVPIGPIAYPSFDSATLSSTPIEPAWIEEPLREVIIPSMMVAAFAHIAAANSSLPPRGVETCAVLCGKMKDDKYYITHLVVPKQKGDEDNCEMLNEDELLHLCIDEHLLTLGWIHTHPSQKCFMSSMDQHTHCGYQSTLSEAVAIVVAPKDASCSVGVFRLTDKPGSAGLEFIQRCELRGFHPHTTPVPIYGHAGHCKFQDVEFSIKDLR